MGILKLKLSPTKNSHGVIFKAEQSRAGRRTRELENSHRNRSPRKLRTKA